MAPVATHDTHRTAIPQQEPVLTEKRGLFGRRQHPANTTPAGTHVDANHVAPGPYGHSFKFGTWLK